MSLPPAPPSAVPRRLYRTDNRRLVAGVAGGLADHLGVDVLLVRLGFVALTLMGGVGAFLYAICWVVVPQQPEAGVDRVRQRGRLVALLVVVLGAAVALGQVHALRLFPTGEVLVPIMVGGVGVALMWRQADDAERARWSAAGWPWLGSISSRRRVALLRIGGGALLVTAGVVGFLAATGKLREAGKGLAATAVVIAGIALISGPWWWRLMRELSLERRERIRSQERAEVAAHVHDSVLHTLALIQRHVDEPREVQRLARMQERALRSWLYRPAIDQSADLVSTALENTAAEVEEQHGVPIEVIVVGDCSIDERLGALVEAAREAMVNAAKFAGGDPVSVYAEVDADQLTVFVRDRGPGFEPAAVPGDRYGIAESIIGRMRRHGGRADLRSSSAAGTEVELSMARSRR